MPKTRIFSSKKSIESKQMGCMVDVFVDVTFQENGLVRVEIEHVSKIINDYRQHKFQPAYLTQAEWEAVEPVYVENCIEY